MPSSSVSRSRSASGSSRSPRGGGNNDGDADRARSMSRSSYSSRSRSRRGDSRGRSNSRSGGRRGRSRSRSYRGHRRSADPRRNEEEIVRLRDGSIGRTPSPSVDKKRADGYDYEQMEVSNADAAFVLGRQGRTKQKLAKVSRADIELREKVQGDKAAGDVIEIGGTPDVRRRAIKYIKCVIAQRTGPVMVDEEADDDDDLTILKVPREAAGFVTGAGGSFLRAVEEEWSTIMFFADFNATNKDKTREFETLAIFGAKRSREGAMLKVMSAVETKVPGHFTNDIELTECHDEGEGMDIIRLEDDEISYALGKKGGTRKKIAASSGAVVEYVGNYVHIYGTLVERQKAKEYIDWLFAQLKGPVFVDATGRDDCTIVDVPRECVGYITGYKRETLGRIEEEWGCLMFFMDKAKDKRDKAALKDASGTEKLTIFGAQRSRRGALLKVMSSVETKNPGWFTDGCTEKRHKDVKGFATDRMYLSSDDLSYALGKRGTTRKKLAAASGCILEYVGQWCFMAGTEPQRERCRKYLKWLTAQRHGPVSLGSRDLRGRDDWDRVEVKRELRSQLAGNRGQELRRVEEDTSTFCFMAYNEDKSDERLLVFGYSQANREKAIRQIEDLLRQFEYGRGGYGRGYDDDYYGRSRGGYNDYGGSSYYGRGGGGGDSYYGRGGGDSYYEGRRGGDWWGSSSSSRDRRDSYYSGGGRGGNRRSRSASYGDYRESRKRDYY
ncbi:hypothetical protein FOZ60_017055 [Perkinsus olseni]|uniref:K Homology domain-containing protein n=2 Tax=Perkinsus olseni TaxID=32597 RepID=A0A7J6P4D1_PEROL|nr:hypothetical protein FOZ60_017055 [Perkinsus olseni]